MRLQGLTFPKALTPSALGSHLCPFVPDGLGSLPDQTLAVKLQPNIEHVFLCWQPALDGGGGLWERQRETGEFCLQICHKTRGFVWDLDPLFGDQRLARRVCRARQLLIIDSVSRCHRNERHLCRADEWFDACWRAWILMHGHKQWWYGWERREKETVCLARLWFWPGVATVDCSALARLAAETWNVLV